MKAYHKVDQYTPHRFSLSIPWGREPSPHRWAHGCLGCAGLCSRSCGHGLRSRRVWRPRWPAVPKHPRRGHGMWRCSAAGQATTVGWFHRSCPTNTVEEKEIQTVGVGSMNRAVAKTQQLCLFLDYAFTLMKKATEQHGSLSYQYRTGLSNLVWVWCPNILLVCYIGQFHLNVRFNSDVKGQSVYLFRHIFTSVFVWEYLISLLFYPLNALREKIMCCLMSTHPHHFHSNNGIYFVKCTSPKNAKQPHKTMLPPQTSQCDYLCHCIYVLYM